MTVNDRLEAADVQVDVDATEPFADHLDCEVSAYAELEAGYKVEVEDGVAFIVKEVSSWTRSLTWFCESHQVALGEPKEWEWNT